MTKEDVVTLTRDVSDLRRRNKTAVISHDKKKKEWDVEFYHGSPQGSPFDFAIYETQKEAIKNACKWISDDKLKKVL